MQLEHSFTVPVGIDETWRVLLDVEKSALCLPGAVVDTIDGDDITGSMRVKLGPINLTYQGRAHIAERDADARRIVVSADGTDTRGNGTATTTVTATLSANGEVTTVDVRTDLEFTGKPAQFGRDIMVDVGAKLIGQFGDALAATLRGDPPVAAVTRAAPTRKTAAKKAGKKAAKKAVAKKAAKKAAAKKAPTKKTAPPLAPIVEQSAPQPVPESLSQSLSESLPESRPAASTPPVVAAVAGTPAFGVPGGLPVSQPDEEPSVNGHTTSSASEPRREVEARGSQSGVPALAKKAAPIIAPVAVALVVVLAAQQRRKRRR